MPEEFALEGIPRAPDRLDDVGMFIVLQDVLHQSGGLTRNALHRAMLIAESLGRPVTVLTVDFVPNLDYSREWFRKLGLIDERVVIVNLFEDAGVGGGEPHRLFSGTGVDAGCSGCVGSDEGPRDDWHPSHSRDSDGRTVTTYHDSEAGARRRETCDMSGRLRDVETIDPGSGRSIRRLLLDPVGRVRVEMERASLETGRWTIRFADETGRCTRVFGSAKHMRTVWFESYAALHRESVFQVETESALLARAVLEISDPSVAKVAMQHSSHLDHPHTYGSPTVPEHAPTLRSLNSFDAFVLITEAHRKDIAEQFGPRDTLHAVVHDAPHSRDDLSPDKDPLLGVGVGRLVARKNWDHVIRAFAQVSAAVPGARFELWGTGPLREEHETLVSEMGLEGAFRIMGSTGDPASVFARASYSVLTGIREGMPLVLTESMAQGTPGIAYDGKYGPSEIIRHGVDGLLVPYGDVDGLARAMLALLSDPDRAASMGRRALEVDRRFTARACVEGWLSVYLAALEQKSHRVVLPSMKCRVERARVKTGICRVEARLEFEGLDAIPTVRLYLRPRGTIVGARYIGITDVEPDDGGLRFSAEFDLGFMTSEDMKWDAFASVTLRNAHQFVRIGAASDSVVAGWTGMVPFVTTEGNLSFRATRPLHEVRLRLGGAHDGSGRTRTGS